MRGEAGARRSRSRSAWPRSSRSSPASCRRLRREQGQAAAGAGRPDAEERRPGRADRVQGAAGLQAARPGPGGPRPHAQGRHRVGSRGSQLLVGSTGAKDATLLPASFKEALGLLPGDSLDFAAVKLGPDGIQAFRYPDLAPKDFDKRVTLYVSPNSDGVMTVACLAPAGDSGFKSQCEAVADTMQVSGGKAFPVGPDPAYAKLVGNTFNKLDGDVAKGTKALNKNGASFRAQAAAARDIQAAYNAAAKKLRGADTGPADTAANAALVSALAANANAWKKAGAAAARKDKKGSRAPRARSSRRGRSSPRRCRGCRPAGTRSVVGRPPRELGSRVRANVTKFA